MEGMNEMKKISFDEACKIHSDLTTKDSEDWMIVPFGEKVHITPMREREGRTEFKYGLGKLSALKSMIASLKCGHKVGCVMFIETSDSSAYGGTELLNWLRTEAELKKFNVMIMRGPASTLDAVNNDPLNFECDGNA